MSGRKKTALFYRFLHFCVRHTYPKTKVLGLENLPDEPCLIVGNHSQIHGPIICELTFPENRYTWCVGQLMHWKEAPAFAFMDFWSAKPKYTHWFYKLLSYLITPLAVCVFNNANTIPVYRDSRVITTFKTTVRRLEEGASVVIFPEHEVPHNNVINDFQSPFIEVAHLYHRRTGKALQFVPMYIYPELHTLCLGKPTRFDGQAPIAQERTRICQYLMDEVSRMGLALPPHRVVPFLNVNKKDYRTNTPTEEDIQKFGIERKGES